MGKKASTSAGLLLYRRTSGRLEIFLAHPGGPFWKKRDEGAWTIPKGIVEPGEEPIDAAVREFREETGIEPRGPYHPLGTIRQKAGKVVHAWAWEGDADARQIRSNMAKTEWPRGSGRWITYPEVDRCAWYGVGDAKRLMNQAQAEFVERLASEIGSNGRPTLNPEENVP
jgi:predicted NUDIX family NTP pyrophosphohydrolase